MSAHGADYDSFQVLPTRTGVFSDLDQVVVIATKVLHSGRGKYSGHFPRPLGEGKFFAEIEKQG